MKKGEFGVFLSEKRKEVKKTVRGFASEIGISPSFLCDLESGARSFPSNSKFPDLLDRIITALNLSSEEERKIRELADESIYSKNLISSDVSEYLKELPIAQQALRRAKELNAGDDVWENFLKTLE